MIRSFVEENSTILSAQVFDDDDDNDNNSTSLLTKGGHVEEKDGVTRWVKASPPATRWLAGWAGESTGLLSKRLS